MSGLGLNAEHTPDITKRVDEWSILGRHDDQTDSEDSKGCRRLDEHRGNACVRASQLWVLLLLHECSHPQEPEADHRGDDDIQAHAHRYPRHDGADRLPVQNKFVSTMPYDSLNHHYDHEH